MAGSDEVDLDRLLAAYNPWWAAPGGQWRRALPPFERPVLAQLEGDLAAVRQMISVTGPRRVGKTTLLRQLVTHLLDRSGVPPERILYLSLDDPQLFTSRALQARIVDLLVERQRVQPNATHAAHYFFLDEIQRLPNWEFFLKKYYDLQYPIRFVVSGSASMPIVRQSRESLAGRIKDRHLLPFSFREFCLFRLREDAGFRDILLAYPLLRRDLIAGRAAEVRDLLLRLDSDLLRFREQLNRCTQDYLRDGGFPEVWSIADAAGKQEYLWDSFIKRVLYEDLAERRKPEDLARLCLYLLANPGLELNTARIASEASVTRQIAEAYLRHLTAADLVQRVSKFRSAPFRVRKGNVKYYVVDLALQHTVAKTWDAVAQDDNLAGRCTENLVANHLASWSETLELAFYRDDEREVDFVVTCERGARLPIEVKHRREMEGPRALEWFMRKYGAALGLVVTREQTPDLRGSVLTIPLRYFLLAT